MTKQNFVVESKETVMALYKRVVRSHLKYTIQVWNPYLTKDLS